MFDWIKKLWTQLFTAEKFPGEDKKSLGGKKIGEVYDIDYKLEDGEIKIIFDKKE